MYGHFLKELIRPYYLRYVYFQLSESNRPESFNKCWSYDWRAPEEFRALDPLPDGGKDIYILPMADWHGTMQRTQHLALALARGGNRCFFQNPHLGREYPSPFPASRGSRVALLHDRIYEVHVHLPLEPVYHHRPLFAHEIRRIVDTHLGLVERAKPQDSLILASFPSWAPVALKLRQELGCQLAYDCHDYLPEFPGVSPTLHEAERTLFQSSDIVFFSSEWLRSKWLHEFPGLARRTRVVRNGVTLEDFSTPAAQAFEPRDRPVTIGYVGAMSSWFDIELVEFLVRSRPDWKFVFVGEVTEKELCKISRHPNTEFTGTIPYHSLAAYLNRFSAAIIPFHISPLTLAVNPIKLYEYLSAALPVVSTPLPEVERFAPLVSIAPNHAAFLEALEQGLRSDNPDLRKLRIEAVRNENWAHRAQDILSFNSELGSRDKTT